MVKWLSPYCLAEISRLIPEIQKMVDAYCEPIQMQLGYHNQFLVGGLIWVWDVVTYDVAEHSIGMATEYEKI